MSLAAVARGDALAKDTDAVADLVGVALDAVRVGTAVRGGPVPAGDPDAPSRAVIAAFAADPLPDTGIGATAALQALGAAFAAGSADPGDPACAAHLHCPPLAVAVAADLVAALVNASLDSWDQGPAAVAVEDEVLAALAGLAGLDPARAAGTMTSGGTASNLTALHLARERAGAPVRILCSDLAHFSVARAAGVLGLGEDAVLAVPADRERRLDTGELEEALGASRGPCVVVATAGTTDFGSVDPLREVVAVARAHGAWCHVDAAYGGGALFSQRLAPLLDGLDGADSIGLDLHKLGWQPVAAGVLLVRDRDLLSPLQRRVAYLNAADDEDAGYTSLLGRSLRTTRRADALKVAVTLRALGRDGLGALVDACHGLARYAAAAIAAQPRLELVAAPVLTSVVLRYRPAAGAAADVVNARIRRRLLREGRAVIGRTEVDGRVALKLTLLNPQASERDVDRLLDLIVAAGDAEGAR